MEKVEAMGLKQMGMWMNEHTSGAALREVWTLDCAALHYFYIDISKGEEPEQKTKG